MRAAPVSKPFASRMVPSAPPVALFVMRDAFDGTRLSFNAATAVISFR